MPLPFATKAERRGPTPFSTEWIHSPPEPEPARRVPDLPAWFPSDSGLTAVLVVLLTLAIAIIGGGFGRAAPSPEHNREQVAAVVLPTRTPAAPTPAQPTAPARSVDPTATLVTDLDLASDGDAGVAVGGEDRAILPRYRILSYYGHPNDPNMGIIGQYDKQTLLQRLREQQAAYEAADPSRPVKLAFEVIASVAQNWPADDNTYLMYTGRHILDDYATFCEENGLLLILDIQIGHSTIQDEIERIRPWLELPYVHLAIDPEFAVAEGQIPGQAIGGVDAADIAYAQEALAQIAAENNLPPKVLIVHQFEEGMIRGAEQLAPVPGVQLVIEFDGFGDPSNKIAGYNLFIRDRPIEHGGIKLFFDQDAPLLTPQEVVALTPAPDLVIYQ